MDKRQAIYEDIIRNAVRQSINEALEENSEDEGWLNQVGSGLKGFFGRSNSGYRGNVGANYSRTDPVYNLNGRFRAAKAGYQNQGVIDKQNELLNAAQTLVNAGFNPNTTIADVMRQAKVARGGANGRFTQAVDRIYN